MDRNEKITTIAASVITVTSAIWLTYSVYQTKKDSKKIEAKLATFDSAAK